MLNKIQLYHHIIDLGAHSSDSVDYAEYGHLVGNSVANKEADRGIVLCGSGIGMSIVANKHKYIRAALCHDIKSAKLSRQHNNANVMTIGARLTAKNVALKCVNVFMKTNFKGGRHLRRIKKI